eukprot:m.101333 g.101333  ORF g.101333 m.101333 type:complete len:50 (+) comp15450_c0_seq3:1227-1376(+)
MPQAKQRVQFSPENFRYLRVLFLLFFGGEELFDSHPTADEKVVRGTWSE